MLNTFDIVGGAAKAAFRIYEGLLQHDINIEYLVMRNTSGDKNILVLNSAFQRIRSIIAGTLELIPGKLFYKKPFSIQWTPDVLIKYINNSDADIINLHWINSGFINIKTIGKINKPIVWTLHDMWPFTGGCHYSYECDKFQNHCGNCPYLSSSIKYDLSYFTFLRKKKYWRKQRFTIVTPSKWLAEKAAQSSLFKNYSIETIKNGLNINKYKPIEKSFARKILNLPDDEKLILFITSSLEKNDRKGGRFILEIKEMIDKTKTFAGYRIVIVGMSKPKNINYKKISFLGKLNDDYSMVLAYSAADVFVLMSDADNLPNTVAESLACGTPVVSFAIGGIIEMIEHKKNGYLAEPFKLDEIVKGLEFILNSNDEQYRRLCEKARVKALKEYNINTNVKKYLEIYKQINSLND